VSAPTFVSHSLDHLQPTEPVSQIETSSPGQGGRQVTGAATGPLARSSFLEVEAPREPVVELSEEKIAATKHHPSALPAEIEAGLGMSGPKEDAQKEGEDPGKPFFPPPREIQQRDLDRIGAELVSDLPALDPTASGNPQYRTVPFQVLSWYPRIVLFPKFLDYNKCDHVVEIGKSKMYKSGLVLRKGETETGTRDIRTSSGTFLSRAHDPEGVLGEIEDRIADWTSLPVKHGEPFNLLHYEHGQHYDSHYDAFDETYGPQASQRLATVLIYLSTVEEGGETVFPLEGEDGLERLKGIDYKRCDLGFKYKPRKGDAVLFYSLHPNGTIDKHSLHGGCPVIKGDKWVMTKWIRDKCFGRC